MTIILYLASALNIFFALFLWIKNPEDKINLNVSLVALFCGIYAFGCASERLTPYYLPMYVYLATKISWMGVLGIPPYVRFSYYLSQNLKHLKIKMFIFYFLAIAIVLLTWTTSLVIAPNTETTSLVIAPGIEYHVVDPELGPLAIWGRLYLLIGLSVAMYNILKGYKKAVGFRKSQLKYFILGVFIFGGSLIIFVGFIPFVFNYEEFAQWPAVLSVAWLGFTAFAIVRYRLMDIDTVIHRTILWMITSSVIFIPITGMIYFLRSWLVHITWMQLALLATVLVYVYLYSYPKIQPRIDHLFRRRKYDYYHILGEIGQKIGSELDINRVVNRLFNELRDVLYIRNGLILVQQPGQQHYTEAGSIGYEALLETHKAEKVLLNYQDPLSRWLNQHQKALEREQLEIDPQYAAIKEQALAFFQSNAIEVLIPLIMENKVNAMVGIGKKENLQSYTIKDIELLENLGRQIGITIDNALHHEDIVEKERLAEELKLGREIQMTLLPIETPQIPGLALQGLMQPAKEIGGDYYDFITLPKKEELAIVIGDVSGKGVAAGLIMAMAKTAIYTLSQKEASPRQILLRTNSILNQYMDSQKFMTMLYLMWQPQTKTFTYSSAGHEYILLYRNSSQSIEVIRSGGFMLGIIPHIETFMEEKEIKLEPGDKILLYTDGVTEAQNQAGYMFGLDRLKGAFQKHSKKPAPELMQSIKDEIYSFIGNREQYDDITLVAMEAAV